MKYALIVSGLHANQGSDHSSRDAASTTNEAAEHVPVVRRFPPVLQFLTRAAPFIEGQLQSAAVHAFKQGRRIEQICGVLYHTAHELGYHVTIGVQEVYSSNMPSFPGETVMTALLLVDASELRPVYN
ncbi:MAG: hypothetical protein SH809_12360 [Rhodothermales bacterium]|nr:hypothetical protein [Rhodothermales bacterium]